MSWLNYAYGARLSYVLAYMLQASEYAFPAFYRWVFATVRFDTVMKRRTLELTPKARALLVVLYALHVLLLVWIVWCFMQIALGWVLVGLGTAILLPYILAILVMVPLGIGTLLIQKPKERALLNSAQRLYAKHPGRKIAVVGSFGKTTMKEFLRTILDEAFHVAASPGNMNTPYGLSVFAQKLDGSEDILILEYGEARPGDIDRLSALTAPTDAVITGLSSAHLHAFKSLTNIEATLFEIRPYLQDGRLYVNGDSGMSDKYLGGDAVTVYSESGVADWRVDNIKADLDGTSFVLGVNDQRYRCHTTVIGKHLVSPLVAAMRIAYDCGMSLKDIVSTLQYIQPFEHRMQKRIIDGAVVIDDTYNGNVSGFQAGLELLKNVHADRKIYVTPGLVEQGAQTETVHTKIGAMIAQAEPDKVYLMNNSVTRYIKQGMENAGFGGELVIIDEPLEFYTHLPMYFGAGDVVLMQNDWTDNYK